MERRFASSRQLSGGGQGKAGHTFDLPHTFFKNCGNIRKVKFTVLAIFKYDSVASTAFAVLCSHHQYPHPELFHHAN